MGTPHKPPSFLQKILNFVMSFFGGSSSKTVNRKPSSLQIHQQKAIETLEKLKDSGVLSPKDYQTKKSRILNNTENSK